MIFFETAGQARAFLLLLGAGFLSGACYDAAKVLRRKAPRLVGMALDALWCLAVAMSCALALALGGQSQARLYALLGLCCGGLLYLWGPRALAAGLLRRVRRRGRPPDPGESS